jgi:outer membrane immunogenic protein
MRRSIGCWGMLASVLCGVPLATAADLPAAAPVYKAPPVVAAYDWTGFYVGGNVGYSWGGTDSTVTPAFFGGTFPHFNTLRLDGVVGGAQIGYNWQVSPSWVFGLEADWQGASERATQSYSDPFLLGFAGGTINTSVNTQIAWFGTARGRIGYAWDRVMIYGTGGVAYGDVKLNGAGVESGNGLGGPFNGTAPFSASRVNVGWTAGAGIEGALARNWTWKVEYLYVDLGSLGVTAPGAFPSFPPETISANARFTDSIVRMGLNLRLN